MAARAAALNSCWNSGFFRGRVVALWGGWEDLRQQNGAAGCAMRWWPQAPMR